MASLYIHIPFCHKACSYCNFYFVVSPHRLGEYVTALMTEITQRASESNEVIESIYFGGGTPSLMSISHWAQILECIYSHYSVASDLELSTESNPEDLSPQYIAELQSLGFNRLSIGIQSWNDHLLLALNRNHNSTTAHRALISATDIFDNVSIDLMFHLPMQTADDWQHTLSRSLTYPIRHISTYNLTIEEKTALNRQISNHQIIPAEHELSAIMYQYTIDALISRGWEHYEISNFCMPGYRSRHNYAYWTQRDYLGFGPSAHSYIHHTRRHNVRNLKSYLQAISQQQPYYEYEPLTTLDRWNEYVLVRLRIAEGMLWSHIDQHFGDRFRSHTLNTLSSPKLAGMIAYDHQRIWLTTIGKFYADAIASELMIVD